MSLQTVALMQNAHPLQIWATTDYPGMITKLYH